MAEYEILKSIAKLDEEPIFDINAETAAGPITERRRVSITASESLINILIFMHQQIIILNDEIKKLNERLEKQDILAEDKEVRMYTIKHALEDKDWVEPDELFEIEAR